jgi:hypothetical protein
MHFIGLRQLTDFGCCASRIRDVGREILVTTPKSGKAGPKLKKP